MSVIGCNIDLFAIDQTVYEIEDEHHIRIIAKVPMENLGTFIARYSNENNIKEIHLIGYTDYAVDIRNKILEANKTKFKNNIPLNIILKEKGNNNE